MTTGLITRDRTARQEHRCEAGDTITPGQRYVEQVIPPWLPVVDDVDDDGRNIANPTGVWTTMRWHTYCDWRDLP